MFDRRGSSSPRLAVRRCNRNAHRAASQKNILVNAHIILLLSTEMFEIRMDNRISLIEEYKISTLSR